MEKPNEKFKDRLQQALLTANLKAIDLSISAKIPKSSISQYLSGYVVPKSDRMYKIAKILNVNPVWLMGYDVPMIEEPPPPMSEIREIKNIFPVEKHKIPLLGEIACGQPIFADEDRESYIEIGTDIHADFCLKAHGDSMINARILDGDIVFIRKQEMVENGEIAAVIIDDEATLKRVYYEKDKGKLVLQAENSAYAPLIYIGDELNSIRILGKAIAFQSDVK